MCLILFFLFFDFNDFCIFASNFMKVISHYSPYMKLRWVHLSYSSFFFLDFLILLKIDRKKER